MLLAAFFAAPVFAAPMPDVLDAHNQHRQQAGLHALQWDDGLAASAAAHAQALARAGALSADADAIGQRIGGVVVVGENVSTARTAGAAASRWFAEQERYRAGDCAPDTEAYATCGHYAAVVAPYAVRLGCGWSEEVLVCRYGTP